MRRTGRGNDALLGQVRARAALIVCVRWRTRRSRVRQAIAAACWASLFTATNRIVGREAASAIASASAMSFFCRFTNGFT